MRSRFVALCLLLATGPTAQAAPRDAGTPGEKAAVTSAMRLNFAALMTLQPYLTSAARFADPASAQEIRHQLEILQRSPHVLASSAAAREPGLAAVTQLFGGYLASVQRRFDRGQTEAARHQLLTATGFCFACHSRLAVEKDFQDVEQQVNALGLGDLDRADLYAATRQFDQALTLYGRVLRGKLKGEPDYFAWTDAARSALRITVRVKNSPDAARKLLEPLEARSDLPPHLRQYVSAWRRDVDEWAADKTDPAALSPVQLVARAKELIGAVDLFEDDLPDVPMLRATHYLHAALTREPTGKHRPEALFLLGLAYGSPKDPLLFDLNSLYFEACIRENPRTELARRAYKRLQDEVYFGFTGSSGTHVPPDELERLAALRKLAF